MELGCPREALAACQHQVRSREWAGAQNRSDDRLLQHYQNTLIWQTAEEAAQSPVHQLFHHRLVRGRLMRFYGDIAHASSDIPIQLPGMTSTMGEVAGVKWVINGQQYEETLADIVSRANKLLEPAQEGSAVIGHGDAHNGNVFLKEHPQPPTLLYFDPAFAGHHHPLLAARDLEVKVGRRRGV